MSSTPVKLHPSLAPVSPDSVDDGTTSPDALFDEAFGNKLWQPFKGPLPGTTCLWAAHKRLSNCNLPQDDMSPTELLEFLGVVEIPATARLFQIVEAAARDKLPSVSTVSLAKKWFSHLATPSKTLAGFDELNANNPTTEVGGVSVRLLSQDAPSSGDGDDDDNEEGDGKGQGEKEKNSFEDEVEKILTSGIPPGHRRFFHGTDATAAHNIASDGIRQARFAQISDFGPEFYTAENSNLAFMFSIYAAAAGCGRAAILSFDVPETVCDDLLCWRVTNDEWSDVVSLCHKGDFDKAFIGKESVQVVIGNMSHRVGGSSPGSPVRPFRGLDESVTEVVDIVQHAFRTSSGYILLADKAKVSILLLDIH